MQDIKKTPRYKENPNLNWMTVKTASNEIEYRKNCKLINGKFYVKNIDCIEYKGKWYLITDPLIVKDYETGNYVLKGNPRLRYGIVGSENKQFVLGYFTRNIYNNVQVKTLTHQYDAINTEVLLELGAVEDIANDVWYLRPLSKRDIDFLSTIRKPDFNFEQCGYNIEDNGAEFEAKIKAYDSYQPALSKDVRKYSKFLGDITWGIEAETSTGYIPKNKQWRLGVVPCKDGSLGEGYRSCEFVTVPYKGAKGLQTTLDFATELKLKTKVDLRCSLHIHFGNIPKDKAFVVAYYKLIYKVQDELLKMFPYYKTDWTGVKSKNYCQKLKHLGIYDLEYLNREFYKEYVDECYRKIFTYFSSENLPMGRHYNPKQGKHPVAHKWNRKNRYSLVNFEPLFFSKRRTIEARLHTGTVNSQKIINWLFINVALIKYAEKHTFNILTGKNVTLKDCLDVFSVNSRGRLLSEYLYAYFQERSKYFKQCWVENGDKVTLDHEEDPFYKFQYKNQIVLF